MGKELSQGGEILAWHDISHNYNEDSSDIYTDENVDFVDTVDIVDRSRYLCLP